MAGGTVAVTEFAVLGPVLLDGRSPRGAIERACLARLLVAPGAAVPAEELMEAAWPPERRAGAAGSLRVRLAKLRALLEPDRVAGAPAEVLVRDPSGYRLVVAQETVDAERLARMADEAARLPGPGALDRYEEALALWRGEPFAELDHVEAAAAQARRLHGVRDQMVGRGSSCDVSLRFLATYVGGYAIWLLYGLSIQSAPIVLVHALRLLTGAVTLTVALKLRGPPLRAASWSQCG